MGSKVKRCLSFRASLKSTLFPLSCLWLCASINLCDRRACLIQLCLHCKVTLVLARYCKFSSNWGGSPRLIPFVSRAFWFCSVQNQNKERAPHHVTNQRRFSFSALSMSLDDSYCTVVTDAGNRVQSAVEKLLEMMATSTTQLREAQASQSELVETLRERGEQLEELTARADAVETQLKHEQETREFLAVELNKAEGKKRCRISAASVKFVPVYRNDWLRRNFARGLLQVCWTGMRWRKRRRMRT